MKMAIRAPSLWRMTPPHENREVFVTPEDDRLGRVVQRAFRSAELGACGRVNALERQFAIEAGLGDDFEWAGVAGAFEEAVESSRHSETNPERLSALGYAKSQLRSFFGRWLPASAQGPGKIAA
jgi:hypothetical protein